MEIVENEKRDFKTYENEKLRHFARKLNYEDDQVDMFLEIKESIKAILEKHNVREQALEWDHIGVKLVDGKVVLPPGFEDVLKEIQQENEMINLFVPEELGGFGYSNTFIGPIVDTIAGYDMPLQMMSLLSATVLDPLLRLYKEDYDPIIKKFASGEYFGYVGFTEPQAGSNLQAIKSTSEKVGEDYVLNGTKIFITNGGYAECGLFLAKNIVNGKEEGTNVFIVPGLDGITTLRLEKKSGIRASPTAQLQFENVTVPKEYLVGKVGEGYNKVIERLMGMRASLGFQVTATTKRAYNLAHDYAEQREQFNKPIINFKDIQVKLSRMEQQIPRLIDFAYQTGFALDRHLRQWMPQEVGAGGKNAAEMTAAKMVPTPVREGIAHYYVSGMKVYNTEIANYILYDAQQAFGGIGFVEEMEVNKLARDVRILPIYDGTSEIQKWIVARSQTALGLIPKFKKFVQSYDETTMYEEMLFLRYPELREYL